MRPGDSFQPSPLCRSAKFSRAFGEQCADPVSIRGIPLGNSSLVETARLNGLGPKGYLREALGRIADHPINASTSNDRLPAPWALKGGAACSQAEESGVNSQANDTNMIDALQGASSLQLYQLKATIEGMLADPQRGLAARASLHLGQPVRFVDFRDGQMRRGKIVAFKDTRATVLEQGTKRTWKIPCVAMQGYTEAERQDEPSAYAPPPEPATAAAKAREFQRGDTVTFEDRNGRIITGVAVRINQRTATIGTGDGGSWRVPFHMLRHVLDI